MLIYVTRLNISFLAIDGQPSQVKLIFHLNSLIHSLTSVDDVENWHLNKPLKGLGISKHFSERSAFGPFQDQRYTAGLLNYALRHLSFRLCDSTAALICGMQLFWGRKILKNSHRFIKKMVTFGGKNGLANFRRSELQNSARQKNKFPTLF